MTVIGDCAFTISQISPVDEGVGDDPEAALEHLLKTMVY